MLKFESRGWWQNDDWGHEDLYLFMRRHNVCQKQNKELTLGLRRKGWRLTGVGNDNLEPFSCHSKRYTPRRERSTVIKCIKR